LRLKSRKNTQGKFYIGDALEPLAYEFTDLAAVAKIAKKTWFGIE